MISNPVRNQGFLNGANGMKKIFIFILFFYILVLLQTSFLIHFNIFLSGFLGGSLILIAIFFINLFEKTEEKSGLFLAFFGGFLLDIFSENLFGFYILILMVIAIFIKFILKRYVRAPSIKRF